MYDVKIRIARTGKDIGAALKIRHTVFVIGQSVPQLLEIDGFDSRAKHVLVLYRNKPAGCARIRFLGKKARLERIGVLERYRGKGLGLLLTKYLVAYCKRKKVREIAMHAQYHLRDFYGKLGFRPRGKTFMEAGIRHVEMRMKVA